MCPQRGDRLTSQCSGHSADQPFRDSLGDERDGSSALQVAREDGGAGLCALVGADGRGPDPLQRGDTRPDGHGDPELDSVLHTSEEDQFLAASRCVLHGSSEAHLRNLCAMATDLFAVEKTRVDKPWSTLQRRISGWVAEALKTLSTRADIHECGWRHLRVEESLPSALLQDAKDLPKAACTGERVPDSRRSRLRHCKVNMMTSEQIRVGP